MRANSLENKLQNRPKPEELIKEGILQGEIVQASDQVSTSS